MPPARGTQPCLFRTTSSTPADEQTHARELRALDQIAHNLHGPDGGPRLDLRAYEETYQGAIDTMLAYLDAHPGTDPTAYAE